MGEISVHRLQTMKFTTQFTTPSALGNSSSVWYLHYSHPEHESITINMIFVINILGHVPVLTSSNALIKITSQRSQQ